MGYGARTSQNLVEPTDPEALNEHSECGGDGARVMSEPGRSGFRAPAGADAIRQLAKVTAQLAAADTMAEVLQVAVVDMRRAVRAAVSVLILVETGADGKPTGDLITVGHDGIELEKINRWLRMPLDGDNPASEAVRTRRPVVTVLPDEVRARYPQMADDTPPERSVICLPLNAGDAVLGAIGLTFEDNWNPGPDELDFMTIVADNCAQDHPAGPRVGRGRAPRRPAALPGRCVDRAGQQPWTIR